MPTTTKHLRLVKPDPSESGKTVSYNSDLDALEKGYHVQGFAGVAVAQFDALRYNEATDRWLKALDADVGRRGICQVTAALGATTYTQVMGIVTNSAWAWAVGVPIYISAVTTGLLTATAPFATSRPVGVSISATEILLDHGEHLSRLLRGLSFDIANRHLVIVATGAGDRGLSSEQYSADTGGAIIRGRKSRNATEGSHTAVSSGDALANFLAQGSDGTAFQTGLLLRGETTELWSGTVRGSRWVFFTTPNGTVTLLERVRVEHDGALQALYAVDFAGDITPSSLGASQNDYNPTGLADAVCIRQASSVAVSITGLAGGRDGRLMTIMNINTAANAITLTAEDVLSAAGNRFDLAANVVLAAREAITLRYDATLTRWRAIGGKG